MPTSVMNALGLDILDVERIDHGVRCLEDPALVERLEDNAVVGLGPERGKGRAL